MAEKRLLTRGAADPATLAPFLAARLGLADAAIGALLRGGAVFIEGRRCQDGATTLTVGARLRVFLPTANGADGAHPPAGPAAGASSEERTTSVSKPTASPPKSGDLTPVVIFEDEDLLVIDKPAGLPSQPGPTGGPSLLSVLPGPLHLVHRLDRDASGLLALGKTPEAAAALHKSLARGRLQRAYLALCHGVPDDSGFINLRIARARNPALRQALPATASGGQAARTHYLILEVLPRPASCTLLTLTLDTGRTHQIRVHLSALGHPLFGDRAYGGPPAPRLMLHAADLALPHPRSGRPFRFYSAAPFPYWPDDLPRDPEQLDLLLLR